MLPDQYPRAHSIARQILKMEDAIAVLPLSVFDSPGEIQAFPVEVSSTVIGDHRCIIFTPLKENPNPEKEAPSSSEEWETIPDIQVRHIWKLTEEDTCDVPEDQKTAILSPDWYHQNGTPICPECGSDMEYSHTEILKDQPLKLVVTKRSDDFHVCLEGDPKTWDCGKTQFEAVGKWFSTHRPNAVKWHSPNPQK